MSQDQILTRRGAGDVVVRGGDQDQNQPLSAAAIEDLRAKGWWSWLYPYMPGP